MNDIADTHKGRKGSAYWSDLVGGDTSQYKERVMEDLIREHFAPQAESLIDIGCGTCATILKYRDKLNASRVVCTDYDATIVDEMRLRHAQDSIEWRVADIFDLSDLVCAFDLVFLMDVIHEVYSFYGRPNRDPSLEIDHALGMAHVERAFAQVASIVRPGGGIVITDDVLCDEDPLITVRIRHDATFAVVEKFLAEYRSKNIRVSFSNDRTMTLAARDFNIMLTQYNKIKREDWERWNIERMEIHEYMSAAECRRIFERLGFTTHIVTGTPKAALEEWESDFEMVDGMTALPAKRITALALRSR